MMQELPADNSYWHRPFDNPATPVDDMIRDGHFGTAFSTRAEKEGGIVVGSHKDFDGVPDDDVLGSLTTCQAVCGQFCLQEAPSAYRELTTFSTTLSVKYHPRMQQLKQEHEEWLLRDTTARASPPSGARSGYGAHGIVIGHAHANGCNRRTNFLPGLLS